jgi:DNA-binding transcriptional LysR family regulator
MDLNALEDFLLVARHGGISPASRISGRSKATLSRQVARLEDSLQVRLVERSSNVMRLTDQGRTLATRGEELLADFRDLGTAIQGRDRNPAGVLRLSAPLVFSHLYLGELAAAFRERHPAVILEAHAEDRLVDPVDEGLDVVIRVNPPVGHDLVGRCFLTDELILVAPPGDPQRWRKEEVPAVVLTSLQDRPNWLIRGAGDDELIRIPGVPILRLPSFLMIRRAVLAGAGIAAIPRSIVEDDVRSGTLDCLGRLDGGRTEIWVLHTAKRLISAKVTAFVGFVGEWFQS